MIYRVFLAFQLMPVFCFANPRHVPHRENRPRRKQKGKIDDEEDSRGFGCNHVVNERTCIASGEEKRATTKSRLRKVFAGCNREDNGERVLQAES